MSADEQLRRGRAVLLQHIGAGDRLATAGGVFRIYSDKGGIVAEAETMEALILNLAEQCTS